MVVSVVDPGPPIPMLRRQLELEARVGIGLTSTILTEGGNPPPSDGQGQSSLTRDYPA